MMLVEEGKIALDDSINKYLQNAPSIWNKITIRQLLSHTSGLRGGGWIECDGSPLLQITKKQQFDDIARSNLNYVPGDSAEYSDPGYFLLGMIIENVSGLSYSQFMKQRIFLPNGMTSTIIEDRRKIIKNHVSEYTLHDGQLEQERRVWQNDLPSFYGVWSTIDDLAKWITALENCQVVKKETLLQMWNVTKLKNGNLAIVDGMPYGLGWFTIDLGGQKIVGHPGFLGSAVFHYVDQQFTVILLTNLDVSAGSFQVPLIQKIVAHFRPDLPYSLN
jgi:CubicO group peptidase (beta-lactamase class C family)